MGILRTDRVSGLGGANAIKGSVLFSEKQYFKIDNHEDFQFGTGDWTIEYWWNATSGTGTNNNNYNSVINTLVYSGEVGTWRVGHTFAGNNRIYFATGTGSGFTDVTFDVNVNDGEWHHIAFVRSSNTIIPFVDGVDRTADKTSGSTSDSSSHSTTNPVVIGYNYRDDDYIHGHLSNLRVTKGTAVYTSNFTPPTGELQKLSGTSLLCFQSPGNILKEETGKILQPYRDGSSAEDQAGSNSTYAVATRFTPNSPVGFSTTTDVGTQFGSTFDGVTTFDSQAYMVPPGGNTRERNRGRAVISGGRNGHAMQFINIQSQGNSITFGDSVTGDGVEGYATGSSVRGLFSGTHPSTDNVIEFITFATQSNGTDFGDTTEGRRSGAGLGNDTRGIFCGGIKSNSASTNIMDFVTFTTLGNATDFGDMTEGRDQLAGVNDTTRGCLCGGVVQPGSYRNTIEFITTATTGNAQDFGDMENGFAHSSGASGKTRGLMATGYSPNFNTNINFITIQTTGNTKDFGDLLQARSIGAGMSNTIRGVYAGGYNPSPTPGQNFNIIDFVNIESTGNALDFGDLSLGANYVLQATSDSHGGLSE